MAFSPPGRSPDDIDLGEEESDLARSGVRGVTAVHRIRLDRFGEVLADGAGRGFGRIGRGAFSSASLVLWCPIW
jgi:hypothetical protein